MPQVSDLRHALEGDDMAVTTALVLQGIAGPRARKDLIERFASLPLISPDRQDRIDAAGLS